MVSGQNIITLLSFGELNEISQVFFRCLAEEGSGVRSRCNVYKQQRTKLLIIFR